MLENSQGAAREVGWGEFDGKGAGGPEAANMRPDAGRIQR